MPTNQKTMKSITVVMNKSIGWNYPVGTGRYSIVNKNAPNDYTIAFAGDSTVDNGAHIEAKIPYVDKHTVVRQVAFALARSPGDDNRCHILKNFSVDGATVESMMMMMHMDAVLRDPDEDHPSEWVFQLDSINKSRPDTVVLSVGGNNYRAALQGALPNLMTKKEFFFRQTPASAKKEINGIFARVKEELLDGYKKIIDYLIKNNNNLKRLILVSQYYPALTMFSIYFIYAGFTHVANSNPKIGKDAFTAIQQTIEELYSEIIKYVIQHSQINERNIEIVFADMTSSIDPTGDEHKHQIEPNEIGAKVIAKVIAHAITLDFTTGNNKVKIVLSNNKEGVVVTPLSDDAKDFEVKSIEAFIRKRRWRIPMPSPNTPWPNRLENTFLFFHGNYFDQSYCGLFKFGLIDISIVTVMAGYCWHQAKNKSPNVQACILAVSIAAVSVLAAYFWRHAINQNANRVTSRLAGGIAAPILLCRVLIATTCTLAVWPLLVASHFLMKHCCKQKEPDVIKIKEGTSADDDRIDISSDEPLLGGSKKAKYSGL